MLQLGERACGVLADHVGSGTSVLSSANSPPGRSSSSRGCNSLELITPTALPSSRKIGGPDMPLTIVVSRERRAFFVVHNGGRSDVSRADLRDNADWLTT